MMASDLGPVDSADGNDDKIVALAQVAGDADGDGIGNILESDDDDDGVPDFEDTFPHDALEWADSDGDGVGDNGDAFPNDRDEQLDTDADGIGDREDLDDDGDGVPDMEDDHPLDTDNDAIDNRADPDDDNDGVPDTDDAFPFDGGESADADGDGVGDNADTDDDNDGVADVDDALPFDPVESEDRDQDGVGDNSDAFANDPEEWLDTDGDGQGNNADTDDDGDGVSDESDVFPLDAGESADSDGDGVGDNADAFPQASSEWTDTDDDGVGDNADTDDDGDGYTDQADAYPLDANRQRMFAFRLSGEHDGSRFGYAVTAAGDVDADGLTELLVGAPGAGDQRHGEVHVISGSMLTGADNSDGMLDGLVALEEVAQLPGHWAILGKRHDEHLGYDLSNAGDIVGDGKPVWLLGANGRNNTTAAAYVVSPHDLVARHPAGGPDLGIGIANFLETPGSWELIADGRGHDAVASTTVSGIDDTDGDGTPDLLIGIPRHSDDHRPGAAAPGAAFLVSGAHLSSEYAADTGGGSRIDLSNLVEESGAWKFLGEADGDWAGGSVTPIGDIDGDGLADFAIGALGHTDSLNDQGAVYVISSAALPSADRADGKADRVIGLANAHKQSSSWKLVGEYENGIIGYSVTQSVMNGDGQAELVIASAPGSDHPLAIYVLPLSELSTADSADGSSDGVIGLDRVASLANGWIVRHDEGFRYSASGDYFETAPRIAAGDNNGDGLDEIVAGIPHAFRVCPPEGGICDRGSASSVYFISATDLALADGKDGERDNQVRLTNVIAQDNSWKLVADEIVVDVSSPGDLDGDGAGDLVLGMNSAPYWENTGSAYIVSTAELALADGYDGEKDDIVNLASMPDWYRSFDFDLDGTEDALDSDDDNDGVRDSRDAFPKDPEQSLDTDFDGIGNAADPDDDNDGVVDADDAFPLDPYETIDSDDDGVGDNADNDDDNDGVPDDMDAFPLNFYESVDSDGDGIGDNRDPDDDNDGIPDEEDATPRGANGSAHDGSVGAAGAIGRRESAAGAAAGEHPGPPLVRDSDPMLYRINGEARVLSESDFDGDGLADLIVGPESEPNAVYLVPAAALGEADAADGVADRRVDMDRVPPLRNSWKIIGVDGTRRVSFVGDIDLDARDDLVAAGGEDAWLLTMNAMSAADAVDGRSDGRVALGRGLVDSTGGVRRLLSPVRDPAGWSLADVNADGYEELLIGAPWTGDPTRNDAAYVASGVGWTAADRLDGSMDDLIDLDRLVSRPWYYKLVAEDGEGGGLTIASAGDVNGDGYIDLLVGAPGAVKGGKSGVRVVHLLSGQSLASIDGRDGDADGVIHLHHAQGAGFWRFEGENLDSEGLLSGAGDIDGDGLADMLISGGGGVVLIAGGDIAVADAVDGTSDRVIELSNAVAQMGSYKFTADTSLGSGLRAIGVGDFDDDAMDDILLVGSGSPTAYLIAARDLDELGATDGVVDVSAEITALPNSWILQIAAANGFFDGTASRADLSGDGYPELVITTYAKENASSKATYVVSTAELAIADALDGASDRSISLDSLARLRSTE